MYKGIALIVKKVTKQALNKFLFYKKKRNLLFKIKNKQNR